MSVSIIVSAPWTLFSNRVMRFVSLLGLLVGVGMRDDCKRADRDLVLFEGSAAYQAAALVWDLVLQAGGPSGAVLACAAARRCAC